MTIRIFLIEDDAVLRKELETTLIRNRYEVIAPTGFSQLKDQILDAQPHLILMDINLPENDGFSLCTEIRESSAVPIIFLTARSSTIDQLLGFTLGGDDYVIKPFNTAVLLARISSLISRAYADQHTMILEHNGVNLNVAKSTIEYKSMVQDLTKNELKILYKLFTNPGRIVSRTEIIEFLWENELFIEDNTLSVNVKRIRQKLEDMGVHDFIITRKAQGYMMP